MPGAKSARIIPQSRKLSIDFFLLVGYKIASESGGVVWTDLSDISEVRCAGFSNVCMRKLVTENIESLVPYVAGRPIEEVERDYGIKDIIKLASNENPLGPSPKAVEAVFHSLSKLNRYPDAHSHRLREALSERLGVKKESVVIANGSNEILELLVRTFMIPGDEAIIADPTFLLYSKVVDSAGGKTIRVPLKNLTHDLVAMKERITPKTRFIFINNPNNPTGTIVVRDDFEQFLKGVPDDAIVILDEAYFEFVRHKECPDGKDYIDFKPYVVSVRTFSKAYGLAGLRIGYGLMNSNLAHYINRLRQPFNVNMLAQVGAEAALKDEEFLQKTLKTVQKGLSFLYNEFDKMGLSYVPTQANFLIVDLKTSGSRVCQDLLKLGIIARSLNGHGLDRHIRVTVGLPEENERFVKAIKSVMKGHEKANYNH